MTDKEILLAVLEGKKVECTVYDGLFSIKSDSISLNNEGFLVNHINLKILRLNEDDGAKVEWKII